MNTINKLFAVQVKHQPNKLAVINGKVQLTYAELDRQANQLAQFLKEQGVQNETLVAIAMERSAEVLIAMMAVLKAGGAYVPLDHSHPKERLFLILNQNKISYLLTKKRYFKQFDSYKGLLINIEHSALYAHYPSTPCDQTFTGSHLAYIIFTSGSTGTPKGVMLEHQTVVNFTQYFQRFCSNNAIKRIDFSSNYAFDMAVSNTITALMSGLTVVITDDATKLDTTRYVRFLNDNHINCIKITPSYFKLLLYATESHFIPLNHLKLIVLGGESLSTLECATWNALYPHHQLLNEYGPTETTVAVSYYVFSNSSVFACRPNVPIGTPSAHVQFYLLDKHQRPLKPGRPGELYIGGETLARGYLNQDKLTEKAFIWYKSGNNPPVRLYKTGDLCQQISSDTYDYLGRIDHQVKIRGFRIELGEIEYHLRKHPRIQQATVIAEFSKHSGHEKEKQLIAYYVLKDKQSQLLIQELKSYLRLHLIEAMIPAFFIELQFLPMNANGKLDRTQLPPPEQGSTEVSNTRLPRGKIEKTLVNLWIKELNCPGLTINDNFFELGGHSLIAARIITQINHQLKKEVSINEFYGAPTIAALARCIKRANKARQSTAFISKADALPLGDFQLLIWLSNLFDRKGKVGKLNVVTCKRIKGRLDTAILQQSLHYLLVIYPLLSFKIYKIRPLQRYQTIKKFNFIIKDFTSVHSEDKAIALTAALTAMQQFTWKKAESLVAAQVIQLEAQEFEIQLSLPHIISDGHTGSILFNQWSLIYDHLKNGKSLEIPEDDAFINYLMAEKSNAAERLQQDQQFWQSYLANAELIAFNAHDLIEKKQQLNYSSYLKIPAEVMHHLEHLLYEQHVNINALLGAATALALNRYIKPIESENELLINLVKSMRNNPNYDQSIGCFLRVEPIKIKPDANDTLASLSKKIEQEIIRTGPYQGAPAYIKLASVYNPKKENKLNKWIIKCLLTGYAKLFPSLNIKATSINACTKLATFKKRQGFMINLNLWSNFFKKHEVQQNSISFDSQVIPRPFIQEELFTVDYVLDVCFLRDDNQRPYLVISANLKPEIREAIAQELLARLTGTISVLS